MVVVKVLHFESEGYWFKPHYQDVKKKVYTGAVCRQLFYGKFGTIKKPSFLPPRLLSVNDPVLEMWVKSLSEFNTKYARGINCFSVHVNFVL